MRSRSALWIGALGVVVSGCDDDVLRPALPRDDEMGPRLAVTIGGPAGVENIVELGGTPAAVVDLNRAGVAVGYELRGSDGDRFPVAWTEGEATELARPPGWTFNHNPGDPSAINDAGEIVGHSTFDGQTRAVIWSESAITPLDLPSGASASSATDINESGDVVGSAWFEPQGRGAVLWRDGFAHALPAASGHIGGDAEHINDSGMILGHSHPDDIVRRMAVWEGEELAWVDTDGRIEPILYHWNGISGEGLGYASYNIAGDTIYVWEDGQLQTITDDASQELHVEDVSREGHLVGRIGNTWGLWTADGVFHPWDATQVDRCTQIASDRWVACVRQDVWFVAQFTLDGATPPGSDRVTDLEVTSTTSGTATLRWTQIEDGTGEPARYRLKYAEAPLENWKNATIGCERTIHGTEIGAPISCTVEGLEASTAYEFQLMSFRTVDGAWADAEYSNVAAATTESGGGEPPPPPDDHVSDLAIVDVTSSTMTVRWTQIDDGTGSPARYRVKYSPPPISYGSATRACTIEGEQIGAELSCTIEGLEAGTTYDVQLMSYRLEDGRWADARYSNVVTGETAGGTTVSFEVDDLEAVGATASTVTLRWTQVDDGTGSPAWYRLKYGSPLGDWGDATVGCERTLKGDEIGAEMSCTVEGLAQDTRYDFQMMSYRLEDGAWQNARYSNVADGTTAAQ